MLKKFICLVLVAILNVGLIADADECEHLNKITEQLESGYYRIDDTWHEYRKYWRQTCTRCGDVTTTYVRSDEERHEFDRENDWHIDGENVHHYSKGCSMCGYTEYWTETCSGVNCIKQTVNWRRIR